MSNTVKRSIAVGVQTRTPILIWGDPGTGKTAFVNNLGEELGLPVQTLIASIREPSDFGGLPVVMPDGVRMEAPSWAKYLAGQSKTGGILFIDEISTAPPAVQAALLRVIQEGVVGDLQLPESIARVAAANPPEKAAGGWALAAPLANRFVHLDWGVSGQEWADGALDQWKAGSDVIPTLPKDWRKLIPQSMATVSAYIHTRPNWIFRIPESESEAGKAWPSPRTWEMAAHLMAAVDSIGGDEDVMITLLSGAVGYGAASEFLVWQRELDLPDPEVLLKDPSKFKLPDRPDKVHAALSSVVTAVLSKQPITEQRWTNAWLVLAEAAKQGTPDVAGFAARTLSKHQRDDLPTVIDALQHFVPILREAGLM